MTLAGRIAALLEDGAALTAVELARLVHARNADVRSALTEDRRFAVCNAADGRRPNGRYWTLARNPVPARENRSRPQAEVPPVRESFAALARADGEWWRLGPGPKSVGEAIQAAEGSRCRRVAA